MATQDIVLGGFGPTGSASFIVTRGFGAGPAPVGPSSEAGPERTRMGVARVREVTGSKRRVHVGAARIRESRG